MVLTRSVSGTHRRRTWTSASLPVLRTPRSASTAPRSVMTQSGRGLGPWVAPSQEDQRSPSRGASGEVSTEKTACFSGRWNGMCATAVLQIEEGGGGQAAAPDGRRHHGPPPLDRMRPRRMPCACPSVPHPRLPPPPVYRLSSSSAFVLIGIRPSTPTSAGRRPNGLLPAVGGLTRLNRSGAAGPTAYSEGPHPHRRRRSRVSRLQTTDGLTEDQHELLTLVRTFVDEQILPVATELEHKDEYPTQIVDGMKEMGIFGLMIPEEYGGLGESLLTYALVVEEIARGWMSVSGVINTHFIVAYMLAQHGTEEQKQRLLPRMATGEVRGAFSMSEPGCGSDVAAITSRAVADGDDFVLSGQKMWLTNGARAGVVATLVRTDEGAESVYKNMTTFLVEKEPGFGEVAPGLVVPGKLEKMGYKGVETTEMVLDGHRVPASTVLGGVDAGRGRGFYQMMDGVEVGRVNVAARACGIMVRAFELAVAYAQQRRTFGRQIADHQAIAFKLAEMGTKVAAAHLMMVNAARLKDSGQRNDVEAGVGKLLASGDCFQG